MSHLPPAGTRTGRKHPLSPLHQAPCPGDILCAPFDQLSHPLPPGVLAEAFEIDQHENGGRSRSGLSQQGRCDRVTAQTEVPAFRDPGSQSDNRDTRLDDRQRDVGCPRKRRGNATLAICRVRSERPARRRHEPSVGVRVRLAECGGTIAETFRGDDEIRRVGQLPRGQTRRHDAKPRRQADGYGCGRPATRGGLGRGDELEETPERDVEICRVLS